MCELAVPKVFDHAECLTSMRRLGRCAVLEEIVRPGPTEAGQLNPDLTDLFQENLDWICHHLTKPQEITCDIFFKLK